MPIRLDRALSNLGYGSRRDVAALVRAGRVHVDGEVVRDVALHVDPAAVRLDGEPLEAPAGLLALVHKPVGFVCSHSDREGPTVYSLVPERWMARNPCPTTVGRLDKDSSGLVLVTDQMPLVHELTSPKRHVDKRYEVTLDRPVGDREAELVATFAAGTLVLRGDDTPCRPARLAFADPQHAVVTLIEGRHRQVRRMFAACGFEVVALHRTHVGPYALGDLAAGEWSLVRVG